MEIGYTGSLTPQVMVMETSFFWKQITHLPLPYEMRDLKDH